MHEFEPTAIDAGEPSLAAPVIDPPRSRRPRDLEARYRGVIDQLPAVIYIDGIAEPTRWSTSSRAVEDLLGISRDEWLSTC